MKKLRLDAILFVTLITLLGIFNLLYFDKPAVSELENRALKKKPQFTLSELFSGRYLKDYEEYYSDTFILRDNLVKVSRELNQLMAFLGPDISIVTAYDELQVPQENHPAPKEEKEPEPSAESPSETDGSQNVTPPDGTQVPSDKETGNEQPNGEIKEEAPKDFGDGQNVGYWLVVDGKAVQLFKFNKESFAYYARVLNKYAEELGSDVKIYSMIPPTASEFLKLKKYKGITDSQNDALGFLNSKLGSGISSINVYDALNKHKDEYIYFRTDHHWTALGAYYAYASFMRDKGEEPLALDQYETIELGEFLGSSYTKTLDKSLEKNPDKVTAYKPYTPYEYRMVFGDKEKKADIIDMKYVNDINNKYLAFISTGGATWSVIRTDVKNGRRLMVVKDSFGNALVPFLLPHYEEIYVVDSRFYSISATGKNIVQFVKDHGINEVLFVIYMEDVNWHKFMNSVENLLGKD